MPPSWINAERSPSFNVENPTLGLPTGGSTPDPGGRLSYGPFA
jgi:hypothetical protein